MGCQGHGAWCALQAATYGQVIMDFAFYVFSIGRSLSLRIPRIGVVSRESGGVVTCARGSRDRQSLLAETVGHRVQPSCRPRHQGRVPHACTRCYCTSSPSVSVREACPRRRQAWMSSEDRCASVRTGRPKRHARPQAPAWWPAIRGTRVRQRRGGREECGGNMDLQ